MVLHRNMLSHAHMYTRTPTRTRRRFRKHFDSLRFLILKNILKKVLAIFPILYKVLLVMKNITKLQFTSIEAILLMVLTSILSIICTWLVFVFVVVFPTQKLAVDRGFAKWVVTDNAMGSTKFVWNDLQEIDTEGFTDPDSEVQDMDLMAGVDEPLPRIKNRK